MCAVYSKKYDRIEILLKRTQAFFSIINQLKQKTYIPNLKDWVLRPKGKTINPITISGRKISDQGGSNELCCL